MDPSKPCDTCAFGKKGGAAGEPKNRLTGMICAHAGSPFFCHHNRKTGEEWDWGADQVGFMVLPPNERRVCAGWKAAVRNLFASGWRTELRDERLEDATVLRRYQRWLGTEALALLGQYLAEQDPQKKAAVKAELNDAVGALCGRAS